MTDKQHTLTLYYDEQCGLCNKEIRFYQRIAPNAPILWQPIHILDTLPKPIDELLMDLHAQDNQGHWHIGVEAFEAIWQRLPTPWPWLGKLVSLPGVNHLVKWGYRKFAIWRFNRLGYCSKG